MDENSVKDNIEPIRVVTFDKENEIFVLNHKDLENVLLQENVKNKKVVVISIAGAYRRGKSFLLNFFIRFLTFCTVHGIFPSKDNSDHEDMKWMGNEDDILEGFPWSGGSERHTDGVLLWKEPFIFKTSHEEIVVLLMDTQGSFDSSSTVKECATIFALSTIISSTQIYNISGNLQEDYLSHLQFFTEYGRIALESSHTKAFQNLVFLIRDWSYPYEYNYGYSPEFLEKKLAVDEKQPLELQNVRKHINECFDNISLFFLPHPGTKVATTQDFRGRLADIDLEFRKYLHKFVSSVTADALLKSKQSNSIEITCSNLLTLFETYIKIFQSDTLPEPKSMLVATAEANNLVAYNNSKKMYADEMALFCGAESPYIPANTLDQKHQEYFDHALNYFLNCKKFGGDSFTVQYRSKLEIELNDLYSEFSKSNAHKQVNSYKVIIASTVICLISLLISSILDIVGLDVFMLPFTAISIFCLSIDAFCVYAQFTGGYPHVVYHLNVIPDLLVELIKKKVVEVYVNPKKHS